MGTKRHLVPNLSSIIASCRSGPFLDLFSGMCSVGRAIADERQIWSNDLQCFSQLVASTYFCANDPPISRTDALSLVATLRRAKIDELSQKLSEVVEAESVALNCADIPALSALFDASTSAAQTLSSPSGLKPYDLFCSRYAGTYFGYAQAMEIDSLRYAFDKLRFDGSITSDQWNFMLVALCRAMSRCSNSTGHFAQALYPKPNNIKKVISKRNRSIYSEWLSCISSVVSLGSAEWRRSNYCFNKDAEVLLGDIVNFEIKPAVVYADPPYTKDQYSRFYHLYETAVLYDYPKCSGAGLYRPGRATSNFSLASKVEGAMDGLIRSVAKVGSCLVLSYPMDGLLPNSTDAIPRMIKTHFGVDAKRFTISHRHSTMGASKGKTTHDVTEVIYQVVT